MKYQQPLACLCLLLLISACSQYQPLPETQIQHQTTLSKHWSIKAKLGIRTPAKSGSITLNWQQADTTYTIQIQAPLGQGNATIHGNNEFVVIHRPGKPSLYSDQPQALMLDTFGWLLPMAHLPFWLQGTANPGIPITAADYSTSGILTTLTQAQWQLDFSRHQLIEQTVLPGRIRASREDTQFTLIIRKWHIP
ncbi:MAG: lipoprotein insertase outer membrane protein LolB [Cellvibrionaceae bacterium]|nr:lipoprotein insertase outer membrane protein LolB [Cellvibrionaceae bacterium]